MNMKQCKLLNQAYMTANWVECWMMQLIIWADKMSKIAGMCPVVRPLVSPLVLFHTHPVCLTHVWIHRRAHHFRRLAARENKLIKRHYPELISPVLSICAGVKDFMWEPAALIELKGFALGANLHPGSTVHYSHTHQWASTGCETSRARRMLVSQRLVRGWSTSLKFKGETVGCVLCLKEKKGIFDVCIYKIQTLAFLSLGYNVKALGTIEDANVPVCHVTFNRFLQLPPWE